MRRTTLGVIIGNRGFFPDSVARDGHAEILALLEKENIGAICLTHEDTKFGTVESFGDAVACGNLFRQHADKIDGVLVSLPNFGDERGVANAIRMSGLKVPVLVQAYPDDLKKFAIGQRRDAFCGKFSVCSNLTQYNIPFTLTSKHTMEPNSPAFLNDLRKFAATCRVVRGLKSSRFGAIGVRPASFNSVRYSEKLLEHAGISIDVIGLTDVIGQTNKLSDSDPQVQTKLQAIQKYVNVGDAPPSALIKMAKFGVVVDNWIKENALVGTAMQCWSALEEYFGITPCTIMSMMGNDLLPSACEVDVAGVIAMYALQLASGTPSAIVDWNNNYEDNDNKCVLFHCANFPADFYAEPPRMDSHKILMNIVPLEQTWGSLLGRIKAGPITFLRLSTDDVLGKLVGYVAEGTSTTDPAATWGGIGVVQIDRMQDLFRYICKNNFEHHVSVNMSSAGESIQDAFNTYLEWDVHFHNHDPSR
jgi:L-fucose isomerase-like protein